MIVRYAVAMGLALAGVVTVASPLGAQDGVYRRGVPDTVSYAHYTPSQCLAAIRRRIQVSRRMQDDTLRFSEAADTLATDVRRTARACLAHLSAEAADARELLPLIPAALVADDSVMANAVVRRIVNGARTPRTRADSLKTVTLASMDITIRPFPMGHLARLFAQIDTMHGPAAVAARVTAHINLGIYYTLMRAADDSVGVRQLQQGLSEVGMLDSAGKKQTEVWVGMGRGMLQLLTMMDGDSMPDRTSSVVHGATILGTAGVKPAPGKVTLVVFQGGTTRQSVAAIRRLHATFGDKVDIVFAAKTLGYFKLRGPLSLADETKTLQEYYGSELKVPGTVVLEHTELKRRFDDRVLPQPTANDSAFANISLVIVDGKGKIRALYPGWGAPLEARVERALNKVLGKKG